MSLRAASAMKAAAVVGAAAAAGEPLAIADGAAPSFMPPAQAARPSALAAAAAIQIVFIEHPSLQGRVGRPLMPTTGGRRTPFLIASIA